MLSHRNQSSEEKIRIIADRVRSIAKSLCGGDAGLAITLGRLSDDLFAGFFSEHGPERIAARLLTASVVAGFSGNDGIFGREGPMAGHELSRLAREVRRLGCFLQTELTSLLAH